MKILINSLIVLLGASIGLFVGIALRGKAASSVLIREARITNEAPQRLPAPSSFVALRSNRADDSQLTTQLERDMSMSSGVTRWLYWLEALEKATAADCVRLAQLAKGNSTLVRLVGARWVELDPKHMFDTLASFSASTSLPVGELQRLLFDEWAKRDIDGVIAALSEDKERAVPESWRRSFATSLVEKDAERGLRLMSEWNIENHGPRMTGVKKWAAADPRHAAEFALAHPAGYASRLVLETIGKEWARTDPPGALEYAATKRGALAHLLGSSVLKTWTENNLQESAAWLANAEASTRNKLSPAFVEAWGKYDGASALKWCEANLNGVTFANAAARLVKGVAEIDVSGAAELVASMTPSRARGEAAAVLMEKWLPGYSSDKAVPSEATGWLARLDGNSIRRVLENVQWRWAEADYKSLAVFLASLDAQQVPPQTYSTLARHMARQSPVEALDWASRLPEERRIIAGNDAFSEWQRSQPESARQWLAALPQDDPRRGPFFQNAVSTLVHHPQGAEQLASMSPAEQNAARAIIEKMSIPEERRSTLLNALQPR